MRRSTVFIMFCFAATVPALAQYEIRKVRENWQVPGEIRKVREDWQVPGEIQKAGEIRTAGGIRILKTDCQERLSLGSDTLFAFNRADLTREAEKALMELGPMIARAGRHPAVIEGHTDSIGSVAYNQGLSERRAATVKRWLVAKGFLPGSTPIKGHGKSRPIAPNTKPDGSDDPAGRQLNRRVEVVIDTCR